MAACMRSTAASTSSASRLRPDARGAGSPGAGSMAGGSLGIGSLDLGSLSMADPLREEPANLPDRSGGANRSQATAAQFSTDHFALKLSLFYAAYFCFGGVQLPFFPLWLESRGLDPAMIGLVIAVPTVMRIVATPVIARHADRRAALKETLVVAAMVGALAMVVVGLVEGAI